MDDILSFERKLSKLREVLNKMDWEPDGTNVKQGYKYLTHTKIKGNMSNALVQSRLEWDIQYGELQYRPEIGNMSQHYIIEAKATVFDIDNPEKFRTYTAYGEAADSGDKAMAKAQTNAFKNILSNVFMLSLYTPSEEYAMEVQDAVMMEGGSKYKAKKESAKATILAKNPVKTEEPKQEVKATEDKPSEEKAVKEDVKTSEGDISKTQAMMLEKIMNKVTTLDEATLMPYGTLSEIGLEYNEVLSSGKAERAAEFVSKYKGVMSLH